MTKAMRAIIIMITMTTTTATMAPMGVFFLTFLAALVMRGDALARERRDKPASRDWWTMVYMSMFVHGDLNAKLE